MTTRDPDPFARNYIEGLQSVLERLPFDALGRFMEALQRAHREDRLVLIAGNGGSAATATHMACDLTLSVAKDGRRGLRSIALDNLASITAAANDDGYGTIFSSQIHALARAGDVVVLISGSGNSENVVRAAEMAKARGLAVYGLLGMGGGKVAPLCDDCVIVPSDDYGPIEDVHMIIDHLVTAFLRAWLRESSD